MFYVKNPASLNKPWILSKPEDETPVCIPVDVTKCLHNYHIMAIEFLYHNYRKGMKGSILNQEPDMNFPLQISAFFRALVKGPAIVLVICNRSSSCFWHYHLTNHGNVEVIRVTTKNCKDTYKGDCGKIALLLTVDSLNLCEEIMDHDFFSIVIEDLDQIAIKRVVKKLKSTFNIGLTYRSFYTDPDQKLQWNMLHWANPGCVGKLKDFYGIDNKNLANFSDNYRYWWQRLTWQFCESFKKPSDADKDTYEKIVSDWATENSLNFTPKPERRTKNRKRRTEVPTTDNAVSDDCSEKTDNEVPIDKYVKLPSMDENPIVTSIIKNFEISPEPIISRNSSTLSYTQTRPNCSTFEEKSVIFSFLDEDRPTTSRTESEDFIINLIQKNENKETKKNNINDILKQADALLQN